MSTYEQFYNPKRPDNRMVLLILGFTIAFILCMVFIGCNSVKKATDTKISKSDSSSTQSIDSTVKTENNTVEITQTLKTWDKETVIIFRTDSLNDTYADLVSKNPWWVIEDGKIQIDGSRVESITTRSKGKDSTSIITKDLSKSSVKLKKDGNTAVKTFDKAKTSKKETKRSSAIIYIVLGVLFLFLTFLYFYFKRK